MEQVATMVMVRGARGDFTVCWQPVDESGGSVLHMIVPFIETSLLELLFMYGYRQSFDDEHAKIRPLS